MDGDDGGPELAFMAALPGRVSLPTFSPLLAPASRRLSSCFSEPSRTLPATRKKLAWVSLQGRLVGAEEAASARAIGGGLSPEEAAAWELFTPLQRVLLVAVVAAAAAESKKARRIVQLQSSVDLRDQVLLDMQQKLDDLCEQLNSLNEQARDQGGKFSSMNDGYSGYELVEAEGVKSHSCDHQVSKLDPQSGIVPLEPVSSNEKRVVGKSDSRRGDLFFISNTAEQEERRMSDLSDFCSSVTSSMDIQFSALAAEQDFYNLRKECEEKDEIIKELNAAAHASNVASSKRITDLEDIVRRKNMVIMKLKKDMVVLEQKVIQLTRMQRPSFLASNSSDSKHPVMSNNLLYDMSSSSPSSSDSDSPAVKCEQQIKTPLPQVESDCSQKDCSSKIESEKATFSKNFILPCKSTERQQEGSRSPLTENCLNYTADSGVTLRPRKSVSSEGDVKRLRRRLHQDSRRTTLQRRWI
ncbi:hypothetical protein Taro_004343 [Colocasia esculenta]|uniref:Uncharacterized protein n=1 Tax=Colocasia esculenta TaxID=4460 RepID=A0A843TP87_COLES|nr:hypothetical protein [Colocasia esculenta]